MRFKNLIGGLLMVIAVVLVSVGAGDYHKYVIYDDAVTTTNDTLYQVGFL